MAEQSEAHKKLLEQARGHFRQAHEAMAYLEPKMLEDLRFRCGDQWPEHIRQQRESQKKPCLTLDRMGQFVRQILNDGRQNRPAIHVAPVDDNGDKETAEVLQGLIRHIEQNSDAATAYDVARDYQVSIGIGGFRMRADYCDATSFDQDILIEPITNPFSMFIDPYAMKPDRSDMRYGGLATWIPKEEFKREHPKAETEGWLDFSGLGDSSHLWWNGEDVRVVEYYCIKYEDVELALLATGEVMPLADVPPEIQNTPGAIVKKRKADVPNVKWYKLTGTAVLDEKDLPGDEVPIFPVVGEEHFLDGRREIRGAIRAAKDSQRNFNYTRTAQVEAIALAPKSPYKAAEGQIEGYEQMWANANSVNYATLIYKPTTINGALVPPPQRETAEPPIQALTIASQQAADDMKASFGMYDASVGNRSNETSGRAIVARQREGDNANYHFTDNFKRALRRCGRLLLKWIPVYYDTPGRVERIIGEEGDEKTVTLNAPFDEGGIEKIYDLTTGKYDVVVDSRASVGTRREEAAGAMMELTKALPNVMANAVDLLVSAMDWPGSKTLSDRLKKTLPPNLQEEDGKTPIPPKAMAMLQQQAQMVEQLTAVVNKQAEEINTKQLELESKERIAAWADKVKLAIAEAQLQSKESTELLKQEIAATNKQLDMQNANMDRLSSLLSARLQLLNADEPVGEEETVSTGA